MKYSEYLELEKLLKESNIHIDDIKENPSILNEHLENQLNEASLLALLGGGALLAGITAIFGKNLLRLGIKSFYLKRLKSISIKFRESVLQKAESMAQKTADLRKSAYEKKAELTKDKDQGEDIKNEYILLQNKFRQIDAMLSKETNEAITNMTNNKTKEIHSMIDNLQKLKDTQKIALKGYWDALMPDIRIDAFKKLIQDGVLTDKDIVNRLNKSFQDIKEKQKQSMNDIQSKINQPSKETKPEEQPTKQPQNVTHQQTNPTQNTAQQSTKQPQPEKTQLKKDKL